MAVAVVAALAIGSCSPHKNFPPASQPNGTLQPLRTGHWAGAIGTYRIDFFVDRVLADKVAIHIVGGSLDPNARNTPGNPVSFTDRPTTCKINPDETSFDCLRYKAMHVDNGFLCGTYILREAVYHPCFMPVDRVQ